MNNPLHPIAPPYSKDVDAILSQYPQQDGYILSLFRTFANSARFLRKGVPNLLDKESPLDLRTREITILRTTANRNCEYEWGVHVAIFAKAAKLEENEVHATLQPSSDCWSDREANLIRAIDELCETGTIERATREAFQDNWGVEEQLEILALVGTYSTISFVANVAELPPEPFAARMAAERTRAAEE